MAWQAGCQQTGLVLNPETQQCDVPALSIVGGVVTTQDTFQQPGPVNHLRPERVLAMVQLSATTQVMTDVY